MTCWQLHVQCQVFCLEGPSDLEKLLLLGLVFIWACVQLCVCLTYSGARGTWSTNVTIFARGTLS